MIVDPSTHHANGDLLGSTVFVVDQGIEASSASECQRDSSLAVADQRCLTRTVSQMRESRDERFDSLVWASHAARLGFQRFSVGFAVETAGVSYCLLSVPVVTSSGSRGDVCVSVRVRFEHRLGGVCYESVSEVRAVIAREVSGSTVLGRMRSQDVAVESVAVYDKDGVVVETLSGVSARDALGYDMRFTAGADEPLHMFVMCDDRVFTAMTARRSRVVALTNESATL